MVDAQPAPSRAASGDAPAETLHRVHHSRRAQSLRDFEWVVVDDGSSDGTDALIAGWKAEADFPITYTWQENCGKHPAFNHGAALASGELFLPLDSDDACVPREGTGPAMTAASGKMHSSARRRPSPHPAPLGIGAMV